MAENQGYLLLYRELMNKPIWINSTPEQKVVLVTLLMMANHKENEWEWKGEKFSVKQGQFITSLDKICERSGKGISIQNVRGSLARFEKLDFLTNESTKTGRLITIANWHLYQKELSNPTKQPTKTQQRPNKEVTPNKECNNDNHDNESKPVDRFNEFWGAYPRKVSKVSAVSAFKKIKDFEIDLIITDISKRNLSIDWKKENGKYIPHPATYLNQRRWEDIIEVPKQQTGSDGRIVGDIPKRRDDFY